MLFLKKFKGNDPQGSSALSDFIRNASSEQKKKVYATVIRKATETQNAVIARSGKHSKAPC